MTSLPLLLLLAALPCSDREATSRLLEETASQRPAELPAVLDGLEVRAGDMPLRAHGDVKPAEQASAVKARLEQACALEASAAREQTPPPPSTPERLRAILDRPEFAHARQRNNDLLQRLLREFEAWMDGFFQSRGAQGFAVGTRALILGLAVAVVLWGVLRLRLRRVGVAKTAARTPAQAEPLKLDSPGEHLQRARGALGSDAREAIREGLLSLLSALEQRRLARPDRVKTNRELASELPGRGAPDTLVREVERLVRWYDRAFYSLEPVPSEEAARFVEDVERLQGTLPGVAP